MPTVTVFDKNFEPVGHVSLDSRKRIVLTKALEAIGRIVGGESKDLRFTVACNEAGQILLTPEVTLPVHEAWLYKNKEAYQSIMRGIEQAKRGKVRSLGSFANYVDGDVDEKD